MIPLNTTWDTVLMLLIAGGVGLVGGVGAGLLEIRRDPEKAKEWTGTILSSIILGGIAAVAILYFFSPEETKVVVTDNMSQVVNGYSLTKLVALALIVGSAGASFLLIMQKKAGDIADAKEETAKKTEEVAKKEGQAKAIQVQASEVVRGMGNQAMTSAKSSVVESAQTVLLKAMEDVSSKPVPAEAVAAAAQELGDQVSTAMKDSMEPKVVEAQESILSAGEVVDSTKAPDAPAPAEG